MPRQHLDQLKKEYSEGLAKLKTDSDKKALIALKDKIKEKIDGSTNS
jgi:hypothetical protein